MPRSLDPQGTCRQRLQADGGNFSVGNYSSMKPAVASDSKASTNGRFSLGGIRSMSYNIEL